MKRRKYNLIYKKNLNNIDKRSKQLIERWILRILFTLNGHHEFFHPGIGMTDSSIAYFLNLDKFLDNYKEKNKKEILKIMKQRLVEWESKPSFVFPKILNKNIQKVVRLIKLNQVEKDILIFTIYVKYFDIMANATRLLNDLSIDSLFTALGILLDHKKSKIKKALSPQGKLNQSGLITIDRDGTGPLPNKLEILSLDFADRMMNFHGNIEEMLKDFVRHCTPTPLHVNNFNHISKDLTLLLHYLDKVTANREKGVNILFYGKPGTGKTELTKAIAKKLGFALYEVSYADENDEPISGDKRLKAYKIAQSFFSKSNVLIMFDEIEDVIDSNNDFNHFTPAKQGHKAWMNRILENNPVPAIWITNDIYSMDPALIRRFDISMEIPIPPKSKRKEIIVQDCGKILSEKSIEKIAKNQSVAPALVSKAAKIIKCVSDKVEDKDKAFENILNNTLKAQGYPEIQNHIPRDTLPKTYDPTIINTDVNLQSLADGIKENPNARLCLYGVPGTGKSAFGKWIAQYTDKPFLLKKGSDLISMWVGGTEKNIADAFREAKKEEAVLVFDEVDSFLQDRRNAQRSWEVTQVNEMLVQMENFDGIFIATTNLIDGLDQASMRRFDMKLEFRYLMPDQTWKLFQKECKLMGIQHFMNKTIQRQVEALRDIAPGDFAAIRRQSKLRPITTPDMLIERLKEEIAIKNKERNTAIGFLNT